MGRRSDLTAAILDILGGGSLTYRQIAAALNATRRYVPPDGLFLAVEQIRECVRQHPEAFYIDRNVTPHLVSSLMRGILACRPTGI